MPNTRQHYSGGSSLTCRWVEFIVIITAVLIYSGATHQRTFIWKDDFTLWLDVIKKSPGKDRAYNNLGQAHLRKKAFIQAIPYLKEAVHLNPYFSYARFNLGIAYQGLGLYDKAITEYHKALQGTRRPYFADIHNNLGVCYFNKGWKEQATQEFEQALRIDPLFSKAWFNLELVGGSEK